MRRTGPVGSALLACALIFLTPPSAASATPEGAPDPLAPQVNWGDCSAFFAGGDPLPTAQCTMVPVGGTGAAPADLAVIRIPATGSRIGSLFINPGGPGASAVDSAAGMATA